MPTAEPWTIMNIRNIVKGKGSRDTEKGVPWAKVWNKAQRRAKQPTTVIYGHDARRVRSHMMGLTIRDFNLENIQRVSIQVALKEDG
jgi:hypothetical protein